MRSRKLFIKSCIDPESQCYIQGIGSEIQSRVLFLLSGYLHVQAVIATKLDYSLKLQLILSSLL